MHSTIKQRSFRAVTTTAVVTLTAGLATTATADTVASGLLGPRGIEAGLFGQILVGETSSRPWNPGNRRFTLIFPNPWGAPIVKTLWDLPDAQPGAGPTSDHEQWGSDPSDISAWGPLWTFGLLGGEGPAAYRAKLFQILPKNKVKLIADIGAYQATDPDPNNVDGNPPTESNPNSVTLLPFGKFLVADAANNDVLRVDYSGSIQTIARFKLLPPPFPPTESVPTSIVVGHDHHYYVSTLPGFPGGFSPASAYVYRIKPTAVNAVCDAAAPNADCAVFASGFSAINDIAVAWDGRILVLEMASPSTAALFAPVPSGNLWALSPDGSSRVQLASGLPTPGGISVVGDTAFVTTNALPGITNGTVITIDLTP